MRATVLIPRHVSDATAILASSTSSPALQQQEATPPEATIFRDPQRDEDPSGRLRRRKRFALAEVSAAVACSSGRQRQHEDDSPPAFCHHENPIFLGGDSDSTANHPSLAVVVGVVTRQPRLLFRGWKPRLVDSPARVARKALEGLLSHPQGQQQRLRATDREASTCSVGVTTAAGIESSADSWSNDLSSLLNAAQIHDRMYVRTLPLFRRRRPQKLYKQLLRHHSYPNRNASIAVTVWIQPDPDATMLENSWESRLIHWENQLIKAQSAAGFLSTLGGAYFLCHHLTSACVLAQQQRYLALVLNDPSMYYKCIVNQAYNLIYGGQFRYAHKLLRQVERRVRVHTVQELSGDSRTVILNMCESAKQFGRRVERAAAVLGTPEPLRAHETSAATVRDAGQAVLRSSTPVLSAATSKVVDDLARIRVYQDESRWQDMVVPFQRLSS